MKHRVLVAFVPNSEISIGIACDCCFALRELGHQVQLVDCSSVLSKREANFNDYIAKQIKQYRPTIYFTVHDFGISNKLLYQEDFNIASWFLDDPAQFISHGRATLKKCSFYHAFLYNPEDISLMRDNGYKNVDVLRNATNYKRISEFQNHKKNKDEFCCDVAFVGNYTPKRAEIIKAIAFENNVDVWGTGDWANICNDKIKFHGAIDYFKETPHLYKNAKINLNISDTQGQTSLTNRFFDIPAAGGFLLTDFRKDVDVLFPNNEIQTYCDKKELIEKITYYLCNEKERLKQIDVAQKIIIQEHTYFSRMKKMIQSIDLKNAKKKRLVALPSGITLNAEQKCFIQSLNCDNYSEKELDAFVSDFKEDSFYHQIYFHLAAHFLTKYDFIRAKKFIEEGLAINGDDVLLLNLKGVYCLNVNNLKEAEKLFLLALNKNPAVIETINNLAIVSIEKHDFAQAECLIESVLTLFDDCLPVLASKVKLLTARHCFKEALLCGRKILVLDSAKQYTDIIKNLLLSFSVCD